MNRRPTEEGFQKVIGSLNDNYDLGLRGSDVLESPSKRRQRARTSDQVLGDRLYNQLRVYHYAKQGRLQERLGRFRSDAQALLEREHLPNIWAPHSSRPRDQRTDLRDCLSTVLAAPDGESPPRPNKRAPEHDDEDFSRRTRSRFPQAHPADRTNPVDSIPVRTRNGDLLSASSTQSPRDSTVSRPGRFSTLNNSANSSRISFASNVFSTQQGQETPASSQYTCPKTSQESYAIGTQEQEAMIRSCHVLENGHNGGQRDFEHKDIAISLPPQIDEPAHVADLPIELFSDDTTFSSLPSVRDIDFDQAFRKPDTSFSTTTFEGGLERRLENIWPSFPPRGLNEAPIAVVWEVTRIAVHCGVDLQSLDLVFAGDELWQSQERVRGFLAQQPAFAGKQLPHPCSSSAWEAALRTYQHKDRVVSMSVELTYSPGKDGPLFAVDLQPLKLILGHRLERRFGADRFLEIIMPSPNDKRQHPRAVEKDGAGPEKIIQWLCHGTHYFLGRLWKPLFVKKDETKEVKDPTDPNKTRKIFRKPVTFFATGGNAFRQPRRAHKFPPQSEATNIKRRTKLSLGGLMSWCLELSKSENAGQPYLKLFSRIAISLSRTVPTVVLQQRQIRHLAEDFGQHAVMNDGIGRMSRSLARKIAACLNLDDVPCSYQGRLGSAKGLWTIDVEDDGVVEDDWIETYPSQRKWDCAADDEQHRTFEVLCWARPLRPAQLNQQFIPILEAQAHDAADMRDRIRSCLEAGLRLELNEAKVSLNDPRCFLQWMSQSGMASTDRLHDGSIPFLGSLPDKDEAKVEHLLCSGFDPKQLGYLKELIRQMRAAKSARLEQKAKIEIPCSTYAYMVADFSGTLEEGEVHLSFSSKFQVDGFSDTLLEDMDILVARAPAHFPSDIQRVRVVSRPKLRKLKDVIVFSTKGKRPLADLLSGGDYDGDKAWICWDQRIVHNFRNASPPPEYNFFEEGYLTKTKTTFSQLKNVVDDIDLACEDWIYEGIKFNMEQSLLGICTNYKERLTYHGDSVNSTPALRLSVLVSNLVDQGKQGINFTEENWTNFRKQGLQRELFYPEPEYAKDKPDSAWGRRTNNGQNCHVLDYLKFIVTKPLIQQAQLEFDEAINATDVQHFDADLTRVYKEFDYQAQQSSSNRANRVRDTLYKDIQRLGDKWKEHMTTKGIDYFASSVKMIYDQWINIRPFDADNPSPFSRRLQDSWSLPETEVRIGEKTQSQDWTSPTSQWTQWKASATFALLYKNNAKFVWHMAGRQLAMIKATVATNAPGWRESGHFIVIPTMRGVLKPNSRMITRAVTSDEPMGGASQAALDEVWDFDDSGTIIDDA